MSILKPVSIVAILTGLTGLFTK